MEEHRSYEDLHGICVGEMEDCLGSFSPVGLHEVSTVSLMSRMDKKYVLPALLIPEILRESYRKYQVLEIDGNRIARYQTLYYDTPDYAFYRMHVNGKLNRQKVRVRHYLDTMQQFLEVKQKSNKRRTEKYRIPVDQNDQLDHHARAFLQVYLEPAALEKLHPVLGNNFSRITLVSRKWDERITIDFDLSYRNPVSFSELEAPPMAIIELKQDQSACSPMAQLLREYRIKSIGISKYCLGISQFNKKLKNNQYKRKIQTLKKRLDGQFIFS